MLNLLIIAGIVITTIALSIITTKLVLESAFYTSSEKTKLVLLIWVLPVMGSIIAASRLKKDSIRNREKTERDLVGTLNNLTDQIEKIRNQIDQIDQNRKNKMH